MTDENGQKPPIDLRLRGVPPVVKHAVGGALVALPLYYISSNPSLSLPILMAIMAGLGVIFGIIRRD